MERIDNNSLSVIVPALNEEKFLESTVETVLEAAQSHFNQYEIIIFNDGSTDNTGLVADKISKNNKCVKVIHNKKKMCIGGIYKQGIEMAKMDYIILVNGKNDIAVKELEKIFLLKGKADMIIPYALNKKQRPLKRRIVSGLFVALLNLFFDLNLKYYNHYVLHKRKIINSIKINTNSYAFQAEALIKLIKQGCSYKEVGVNDNFSNDIKTKAFGVRNIFGVANFFFRMSKEVYFCCL
jgi:glycosyltransferase involved in cell wall biosynthesis